MNQILSILPREIKQVLFDVDFSKLEEIRLRSNKNIVLEIAGRKKAIEYKISQQDLSLIIELMTQSSLYAFIEQVRQGFIIIRGGHRVGICGRAVIDCDKIINLTEVSGVNIRIAKEVKNISKGMELSGNILLVSPPNCGKTTMLRDIIRRTSWNKKIALVDERGEIAASFMGVPQFDIGQNTDVLSLCPKVTGIEMMIRSMSPEVIAVDEIATENDVVAIKKAVNCGVDIIATAHGRTVDDVERRLDISIFDCIYILRREGEKFTYDKADWSGGDNARLWVDRVAGF